MLKFWLPEEGKILCQRKKKNTVCIFHICTVHLDTIKVFIYQLMHNRVTLKEY